MRKKIRSIRTPEKEEKKVLDPRQALFISYYFDPKSKTFSNARGSAILAGYEEKYANNIRTLMPAWLLENIGKHDEMADKAEKRLKEVLDVPMKTQAMGALGPLWKTAPKFKGKGKNKVLVQEGVPLMVHNPSLISEVTRNARFVAERLNPKKYGKDSSTTINNFNAIILNDEQRKLLAERILGRGSATA